MTRWKWFVPFGVLVILAGYLGLRYGQPLTETQAISFYAEKYVADRNGTRDHCSAIPSARDNIWIEVICVGPDKTGALYLVQRNGQLAGTIPILAPAS